MKQAEQPSSLARSHTGDRVRENEITLPSTVKRVKNENIFGEAKPVDTSTRQRLIEEKLEKERLVSFLTIKCIFLVFFLIF